MCALIRELAVPVADLHRLAVECTACSTIMIVDLRTQTAVTFCPTCRHDFEPAVKERIRTLGSILTWLNDSKECRFSFRVPPPAE